MEGSENVSQHTPAGLHESTALSTPRELLVRVTLGPLFGLLCNRHHIYEFKSLLWRNIVWAGWRLAREGEASPEEMRRILSDAKGFAARVEIGRDFQPLRTAMQEVEIQLDKPDRDREDAIEQIMRPWIRVLEESVNGDRWVWKKPQIAPHMTLDQTPSFQVFLQEIDRALRSGALVSFADRRAEQIRFAYPAQADLSTPTISANEWIAARAQDDGGRERPIPRRMPPAQSANVEPVPALPEFTPDELTPRIEPVTLTEFDLNKLRERTSLGAQWHERLRQMHSQWHMLPQTAFWGPFSASAVERIALVCTETALQTIWFIGDIHGDLLGLETALYYIRKVDPDSQIIFLGDLIDDGEESIQVLISLYSAILESPGRIAVIPGNHDDALGRDPLTGEFIADVEPATFSEWLNANLADNLLCEFMDDFLKRLRAAPVAIFLPDGTFAAHGGVPHTDLQEKFDNREFLSSPDCVQDFIWTRLHPRARRRVPNRCTRSCELGVSDFEGFRTKAKAVLGQRVERMIRGHDHFTERFRIFEKYGNRVLTINSMCSKLPRESGPGFARTPCLARWKSNHHLEVHQISLPTEFVEEISGMPRGTG